MRSAVLLLLAMTFLSACAPRSQYGVCPVVVPWSRDDQRALMRDLEASKSPFITRAVQEDAGYRAWARGCRGRE
nr:hypothetical protein [uncultured Neokomagataea sp.]